MQVVIIGEARTLEAMRESIWRIASSQTNIGRLGQGERRLHRWAK